MAIKSVFLGTIETNPIASKNYDNYSMPDTLPRPKENSLSLALER